VKQRGFSILSILLVMVLMGITGYFLYINHSKDFVFPNGDICKQFPDKSKNYVASEIIVGFKSEVSTDEQNKVIQSLGSSIKEQLLGQSSYVIKVPANQEGEYIKRFSQNPSVEFAELNGCNNASLN
jgi:hypothetical protein